MCVHECPKHQTMCRINLARLRTIVLLLWLIIRIAIMHQITAYNKAYLRAA